MNSSPGFNNYQLMVNLLSFIPHPTTLSHILFSFPYPFKKTFQEFKKMVMITLYAKQKKRHRCTEQTFGLCGRRRGWDVLRK